VVATESEIQEPVEALAEKAASERNGRAVPLEAVDIVNK
jgi:hypothetical protein